MASTYYTLNPDNSIATASIPTEQPDGLSHRFSDDCLETNREIVRGYDGKLYFTGEEPVKSPEEIAEEQAVKRIAEIKSELTRLDAVSARPLRAIAAGVATTADQSRLESIESQAQALRDELAELEAGNG